MSVHIAITARLHEARTGKYPATRSHHGYYVHGAYARPLPRHGVGGGEGKHAMSVYEAIAVLLALPGAVWAALELLNRLR